MAGVAQTIEVIDAGLAILNAVNASLKDDGKITMADMPKFLGPVMAIPNAIQGAEQIPAELADLDEKELIQVRDHVLKQLPGIGEKWVIVALEAVNAVNSLIKIYRVLKK